MCIYIHTHVCVCIHTSHSNSLEQGIPQSLYLRMIEDMFSLALGLTVILAIYNCSYLQIVIHPPFPKASVLPFGKAL